MEPPQFTPPDDNRQGPYNTPQEGAPPYSSNYPRPTMGGWGMYPPGVYFEFIGKAWQMIMDQKGTWVINSLAAMILLFAGNLASTMLNTLVVGTKTNTTIGPELFTDTIISIGISIPFTFLTYGCYSGMMLSAIDQAQGRPGSVRIFEGFKNFPVMFLTSLLSSIAMYLSILAGCLPVFIVPGLLAFAPFLSSQFGTPPIEALKQSFNMTKPYWLAFAGLYICAGIVSGLGVIACCVGLLFTLPVLPIVLGLQYLALAPQDPGPQSVGPQPPMGMPG